jgi:hypothetical protein
MLLKSYKRPPQYNDYIAKQSLTYMKWILIVHQIGFFMLFKGPVFSKTDQIADPTTTTITSSLDESVRLLQSQTDLTFSPLVAWRDL